LKCSEDGRTAKWDLGGQWVTDTQKNITRLLNEFNIETYSQFDDGKKILESNGKVITYDNPIPLVTYLSQLDLQMMITKTNTNVAKINTLRPFEQMQLAAKLDSMNSEQWLFASSFNQTARTFVETNNRANYGLEMNQQNALFGLVYTKAAGSFEALNLSNPGCAQEKKVKGGTQQISEKLLASVLEESSSNRILFNMEIIGIKQTDDLVEVEVKDTKSSNQILSFKAKKVVCSIPVNLYDRVDFSPDLPSYKWNVIRSSRIGNYVKFIVTYKRAFWRENGFSGEVLSDGSIIVGKTKGESRFSPKIGPINSMFDATNLDNNAALVGFCVADAAVQWLGIIYLVEREFWDIYLIFWDL
jgi:monoamine oxidase